MACYDFCSILNFLGGVFFLVIAAIVSSGHQYQEWNISDESKSKTALFVSAGIHFGFFLLCLVWKFLKERQLAREEGRLGQKGFQKYLDEDNQNEYSQPQQIDSNNNFQRNESNQSHQGHFGQDGVIN